MSVWIVLWSSQGLSSERQATQKQENHHRSLDVLSQTYLVDKKFKSMKGPQGTQKIFLEKEASSEILWITGYEAIMVGADGKTPMPQEFMCHSNLDFDAQAHNKYFERGNYVNPRLFTLSQGQLSIRFPEGFGIPVLSDVPLSLTTQVLNMNLENPDLQIRHRVTIHFVRDRDLKTPLKPLFPSSAYGLALLEGKDGYYGESQPNETEHGPGCLVGRNASGHQYSDQLGRKFTGHWVVKPGWEVNNTLVTKIMNIPYDTMIHYIAVHLHPFAESLELRDLTAGKTLFKSRARSFPDRIGLAHVDYYSSQEGIPVYKDHEYEIISVYNNTTAEDQDSMAVMYLLDKQFKRL